MKESHSSLNLKEMYSIKIFKSNFINLIWKLRQNVKHCVRLPVCDRDKCLFLRSKNIWKNNCLGGISLWKIDLKCVWTEGFSKSNWFTALYTGCIQSGFLYNWMLTPLIHLILIICLTKDYCQVLDILWIFTRINYV